MTYHELVWGHPSPDGLSGWEYNHWMAYSKKRHEDEEKAQKEAEKKRKGRRG